MQHKIKFIFIIFLLAGTFCFPQDQIPPTPSINQTNGPTPPGAPIDGDLVVLLAAGAYYGIKKSLKR